MSRFILHYLGANDPTSQEENRLVSSLGTAVVIDRIPGSLLVEAPESELAETMAAFEQWDFAPEAKVSIEPPDRSVLHEL